MWIWLPENDHCKYYLKVIKYSFLIKNICYLLFLDSWKYRYNLFENPNSIWIHYTSRNRCANWIGRQYHNLERSAPCVGLDDMIKECYIWILMKLWDCLTVYVIVNMNYGKILNHRLYVWYRKSYFIKILYKTNIDILSFF